MWNEALGAARPCRLAEGSQVGGDSMRDRHRHLIRGIILALVGAGFIVITSQLGSKQSTAAEPARMEQPAPQTAAPPNPATASMGQETAGAPAQESGPASAAPAPTQQKAHQAPAARSAAPAARPASPSAVALPPLAAVRTRPGPADRSLPPLTLALDGTGPVGQAMNGAPPTVLWLSGVIEGSPKLAVVRRGQHRYMVREGDAIENQYRVITISSNSVTLQRGGRKQVLRLGQY